MKRFLIGLTLLILCLPTTACGNDPVEPEPIETIEPEPEPPTIEEELGFTGYDLMNYEFSNPYNQVQLIAKMDMTATHKNNIVDYMFTSTKLHESDGYVAYSVISDSLTNEFRTTNETHMTWVEKNDSVTKYYNNNYTGWYYTESEEDVISAKLNMSDKISYSEMQNIGDSRLKVIGESVTSNGSYFDNYIKSVISQFGVEDCSYTFEANYDYNTHELISIMASIDIPGEITHGEYICTVDSFDVSMVVIETSTLKRLTVPDNCKSGSYVSSGALVEPIVDEQPIPVEIVESDIDSQPTEPIEPTEPTEPVEDVESEPAQEQVTLPPLA